MASGGGRRNPRAPRDFTNPLREWRGGEAERPATTRLQVEYFERTRPNLKTFLLTGGYAGEEEDAFDRAMQPIRAEGGAFLRPRPLDHHEE